jgi:transcriptional regulator GlxA family with amidase domain
MERRHRVVALIQPGLSPFELGVASEVFGTDRSDLGVAWYRFAVVAERPGLVPTEHGYRIEATHGLGTLARADTIVVTPTSQRRHPDAVLEALRRAHRRGARLVSLCSGAFVLAAAGLLDGRAATTHWMLCDELAARYPAVDLDPGVLYVDGGDVATSAGTAGSIDLCLHLVRQDLGAEVANAVARRMVVPPHREGGQAQYVDQPLNLAAGSDLFDDALAWALEHLHQPIAVEELARRSAMSQRTFARRFAAVTGTTPHQWLVHQRLQLAQRLLEATDWPVERIAEAAGMGSAANLRLHFQRVRRTSPARYRRTFRLRSA